MMRMSYDAFGQLPHISGSVAAHRPQPPSPVAKQVFANFRSSDNAHIITNDADL